MAEDSRRHRRGQHRRPLQPCLDCQSRSVYESRGPWVLCSSWCTRSTQGYGLYLIYAVGFGSKGSVFIFLSPIQADGDLHGGALHVLLCLAGASPEEI